MLADVRPGVVVRPRADGDYPAEASFHQLRMAYGQSHSRPGRARRPGVVRLP